MMQNIKTIALSATAFFAVATVLQATGYSLYEASARGTVDAPGLTAAGGDPSSLYFNPAAITDLPGTQAQLGFSLVIPDDTVSCVNPYNGSTTETSNKHENWLIPSAYFTHQLNDSIWLGLGFFTRHGLGADINENWAGRYNSYRAMITSFDFNPVVAWRINDEWSIAAGLDVRYFDIELAQKIDAAGMYGLRNYNDPSYSPFDVDQNLHGDDISFGGDVGIMFKPNETVSLGLAYHSRVRFVCKGDADYTKPAAVQMLAPALMNDTTFHAKNYNPDYIMFGGSWKASDKLTLSAGATYTLWSVYDNLVIELHDPIMPGKSQLTSTKNWDDSWRFSVGASYDFRDGLTGRLGYVLDLSPLNDATVDYFVPADDRHIVGAGLSWVKDVWTFDFSYCYDIVKDLKIKGRPANGVFDGEFMDGSAHMLSFSVTRRF